MSKSVLVLVMLVLALWIYAAPAQAATIIDTFGPGDTYRANASVIGFGTFNEWEQGSQFVVSGTEVMRVDAIEIAAGSAKVDVDQIDIHLMTDVSGAPGVIIETLSFTITATDLVGEIVLVNSFLQPILNPGEAYWLIGSAPQAVGAGDWLSWNHSDEAPGRLHAFRTNGGAWEVGTDRTAETFRVTGTPVPEPSTALLLAFGLAGLAARRRWGGAERPAG